MSYDFSGRTAVITGGTGVLGAEMARALAACGADVVLLGRNVGRAEQVIASFAKPTGANRRQAPGAGGRRARSACAGGGLPPGAR